MKLFEEIFRMKFEMFKPKFNLISLSICQNDHRRIYLTHPLPFESVFLGVCAFETVMAELALKSVTLVLDLLT